MHADPHRWIDWPALCAADRLTLLAAPPQGSVVAEVGVYKGRFSQRILEIVTPQRLHWIDPWVHQDIPLWRGRSDEDHLDFLREVPRREAFTEPVFPTSDALACKP